MSDNKKVLKGLNFPGLEGTYYVPEAVAYEEENGYIDVQSVVSDTVEIENLDTTLTREGFAADAKAVGEALKPYIIPIDGQGDENYVYASGFTFNWSELLNMHYNDRNMIVRLFYHFNEQPNNFTDYQRVSLGDPEDYEALVFCHLNGSTNRQIELYEDGTIDMYQDLYASYSHIQDINERAYIQRTYKELTLVSAYDMAFDESSFVIACWDGFRRSTDYGSSWNSVYFDDANARGRKKIIYHANGIYVAISTELGYVYFSFDGGASFVRYDGLSGQILTSIVSTGNNEYAILLNDGRIALLHNPTLQDNGSLSVTHEFDQGAPEEVLTGKEILLYHNQLYALSPSGDIFYKENGTWNSGLQGGGIPSMTDAIVYGNFIVSVGEDSLCWFDTNTLSGVKFYNNPGKKFRNARLAAHEKSNRIYIISDDELVFLTDIDTQSEDRPTYATSHKRGMFDLSDGQHWNRIIGNYNTVYASKNLVDNDGYLCHSFYTFNSEDSFADFNIRKEASSRWSYTNRDITYKRLRASLGAAPKYTYGTEDLEPGVSLLETGTLYFVYE